MNGKTNRGINEEEVLSRKNMFIKMLLPSKSKKKRGHFQFTKRNSRRFKGRKQNSYLNHSKFLISQ